MQLPQARREASEPDRLRDQQLDQHASKAETQNAPGLTERLLGALWDAFAPSIGEALIDVRKKLEELWFGREVTPTEMAVTHHGRHSETTLTPLTFQDIMRAQAMMLLVADQLSRAQGSPDQTNGGPDR